ncbi:MAG: aspartate kinase, partial [Paludibacteraceae bacterium]|nr:aspartate kinase [Paludibacteraceae bacterium]
NMPIRLKNVMSPDSEGTLVSSEMPNGQVKAIAAKDGITMIKIKSVRMLLAHGFLRRVFEVFEGHKTAIDMITTSEIGVSVTIDNDKYLEEIVNDLKTFGTVTVSKGMTIVCVVGDMRCGEGASNKVLDALKELPVQMISYGGSLQNISILVDGKDKKMALNQLNNKLF